MLLRLLIFIVFSSFIQADLEDHFKKAEGKTPVCQMRNIDFIYVINLDQRPEKFAQVSRELNPFGIFPYRFSAVNGWELSLETINDVGVKFKTGMISLFATTYPLEAMGSCSNEFMVEGNRTYFAHCFTKGALGICLSHISVLKDAWDSGYETIWVMEDDVVAVSNPQVLSDLIDRLDALVGRENWDVLFTDQDTKGSDGNYVPAQGVAKRPDMNFSLQERFSEKYTVQRRLSADFKLITARFGAYSMILRRSGIGKLLQFALEHKIFLPYDMDNYSAPGLKRYALNYDVVGALIGAPSDNGVAGYLGDP